MGSGPASGRALKYTLGARRMAHGTLIRSLGAAVLLAAPLAGCSSEDPAQKVAAAPVGERLALQASDTVRWQDVSAEITTVDQAQVLARIPGILTSLTVREGDNVSKGQVIGRIVDSQLGYQSGAYGAQAAAAQAQAAQAQATLGRVRFLYQNGVYAKARLDQAEAMAAAASAQVRAAREQQAAVAAVAGQGAVTAPASGRVLRADVPAGAPVAPGMTIAVITAGPAILRIEMPESVAATVQPGARVMTGEAGTPDATGTVTRVYPAVSAGQVTADVLLPGIDDRLVGRRIAARVETGRRKALLVPARFVTRRYGMDYVTVLAKDGSPAEAPVQTAPATEAGKVELLSGAVAGETLLAPAPGKTPPK